MNSETVARAVLAVAGAYLVIGLGVAVPFVMRGVNRLDPAAAHAPWPFRMVILPGSVVFWPWIAWRRWRGEQAS